MLKGKQEAGVQITHITHVMPDSYGFGGDAAYIDAVVVEDMQKLAFLYIKTVEEYCDHYAVIDQEVVWYGEYINLGWRRIR